MIVDKECIECRGECCKSVAVEIDTPENNKDFEDIKWYLFHKDIEIYISKDGSWNVQFNSKCKYLNKDNLCDIYPNRPPMCRKFSSKECDFEVHNIISFKTVQEFEKWLKKNKDKILKK